MLVSLRFAKSSAVCLVCLLLLVNLTSGRFTVYRTRITTTKEILSEYDFIVVGAGSTGSLLASRLSEVVEWRVLVLEAGEDEAFLSDIPAVSLFLQDTQFNWKYKNEPQMSACLAYERGQCRAPKGKVLGGSGVLSDMVYSRGHKKDYDDWAALGNPGWSFQEVLPYFKKSANMRIPELRGSPLHGVDGELNVERVPFQTELSFVFLEAGKELGYPVVDYNSGDNFGFSRIQVNMINGTRCSGNRAFLSKASKRPNLDVVILAQVTKILMDDQSKQAIGVQFVKNNKTFRVFARKEVVLSAGVFNSPKLLMLSGIGPRDHLTELGIPVVQDLPVGRIVRDHYGYIGNMFRINSTAGVTLKQLVNINTLLQYFKNDGFLTVPLTETQAYIRTKLAQDERPDVLLVFVPTGLGLLQNAFTTIGIRPDVYQNYFARYSQMALWSLSVILLRPDSTGVLKLRSSDPLEEPVIEANFFSDPKDAEVLIEAIKESIKISQTEAFARHGSKVVEDQIPDCERFQFGTDEYWNCAVRQLTTEVHHQTSTCGMGPSSDATSVVDHRLKVHGISRLRVADASVIPVKITGNVNAAAVLVGEKAADLIRREWPHQE